MNEVAVNLDIYSKPLKNPYTSILHMNNTMYQHITWFYIMMNQELYLSHFNFIYKLKNKCQIQMKSKSKNVLKQKKVHKSKGRIHESIVTDIF